MKYVWTALGVGVTLRYGWDAALQIAFVFGHGTGANESPFWIFLAFCAGVFLSVDNIRERLGDEKETK